MNELSEEISCAINQLNEDLLLKVDALYVEAMLNCGLNQRASKHLGDFAAVRAASFRRVGDDLLLQRKKLITTIREHKLGHLLDLIVLPSPIYFAVKKLMLEDLRELETAANTSLYLACLAAGLEMEDLLDPSQRTVKQQPAETEEVIMVVELPAFEKLSPTPSRKHSKRDQLIQGFQAVATAFVPQLFLPYNDGTSINPDSKRAKKDSK